MSVVTERRADRARAQRIADYLAVRFTASLSHVPQPKWKRTMMELDRREAELQEGLGKCLYTPGTRVRRDGLAPITGTVIEHIHGTKAGPNSTRQWCVPVQIDNPRRQQFFPINVLEVIDADAD